MTTPAAVLAFGYEGKQLQILKTACAGLALRLRRADPAEYGQSVGALLGLTPRREDPPPAGPLPGRMLVLAGLTPRQRDALLAALRTARAGDSLKAVLTAHNAAWTAPALYAALARERDALGG